jgi:hypothetical protein
MYLMILKLCDFNEIIKLWKNCMQHSPWKLLRCWSTVAQWFKISNIQVFHLKEPSTAYTVLRIHVTTQSADTVSALWDGAELAKCRSLANIGTYYRKPWTTRIKKVIWETEDLKNNFFTFTVCLTQENNSGNRKPFVNMATFPLSKEN